MVNAIEEAIEKLCKSDLSNYKIAQDTGFSDVVIGNWRKGKTRPSRANAVALLRYFQSQERAETLAKSETYCVDGEIEESTQDDLLKRMVNFLLNQCQVKDRDLEEARKTIAELKEQIKLLKNK